MASETRDRVCIMNEETQTHTVYFLHGFDTGRAANAAESLRRCVDSEGLTLLQRFPSFLWLFPHLAFASRTNPDANPPIDIWKETDLREPKTGFNPRLRERVAAMRDTINHAIDSIGGRPDRIILVGIHWGGTAAMQTLLNMNLHDLPAVKDDESDEHQTDTSRLGALICISSSTPLHGGSLTAMRRDFSVDGAPEGEDNSVIRNTPILVQHCCNDKYISVEGGRALRDTLIGYGADVTWREYPEGGDCILSPTVLDDVVAFIQEHVLKGQNYLGW